MIGISHDLVHHRLQRAFEALEEARVLQEAGHFNASVSRLYYACFYAISALLLTEGHAFAKHTSVLATLDRNWIKPGKIPVQVGRFARKMFERRQQSDYGDLVKFDEADIERWAVQAQETVDALANLIEQALAIP